MDAETNQMVRLFHPRRDLWSDHFSYNNATGELLGLTPIGRATVARLQINSPSQITARLLWVRLGIFP